MSEQSVIITKVNYDEDLGISFKVLGTTPKNDVHYQLSPYFVDDGASWSKVVHDSNLHLDKQDIKNIKEHGSLKGATVLPVSKNLKQSLKKLAAQYLEQNTSRILAKEFAR